MNIKNKQNTLDKQNSKLINMILILCLSVLSVMIGMQAGDIWYKLDVDLVGSVDTENLKNTLNLSLPIIESVYNSGKYSVSFSGEIKDLLAELFGFDLESPVTILNVQSPVFMSYYNRISNTHPGTEQADSSGNNGSSAGKNGSPADNGKAGTEGATPATPGTRDSTGDAGSVTGERDNSGNSTGGTPDNTGGSSNNNSGGNGTAGDTNSAGGGQSGGSNQGAGQKGVVPGNTPAGSGQSPKSGDTDNSGKTGTTGGLKGGSPVDLQPVSSITFETEDDEKEENSDLVALDSIVLNNFTKYKIDIAKLLKEPLNLKFKKSGPKVLIYHTHTSESYVLKQSDLGKKDVPSFSSNPKNSVVRVGEELSRNLRKYGIETLHDGTVHDKRRDAAYGVAIDTLQSYSKSYPSLKVFVDVHRDGVSGSKLRLTKNINGKNAAQIMFVVGSDGILPHPDWKENLKFVLKLQQSLNEKYPGLARPVRIVGKRYNQQISDQAILIEVGGDGNLLSECLESTKYLAEALNKVMSD